LYAIIDMTSKVVMTPAKGVRAREADALFTFGASYSLPPRHHLLHYFYSLLIARLVQHGMYFFKRSCRIYANISQQGVPALFRWLSKKYPRIG
jgi:hypothetical protein